MTRRYEIILPPFPRGFHLVTRLIEEKLPDLPENGICHLMIRHTSAGLTVNENADPSVRMDFQSFFDRLVPERAPYFIHTLEGPDDMPAHLKSSIVGHSITVPIAGNQLYLGTWQGIYLCEFRDHGGARKITATVMGD